MSDIFLSYRRKGAESVAYVLYKDLQRDGYTVFYDHNSLGGGDFLSNIEENIRQCRDFVLILSDNSFGDSIFDPADVYRFEIETALKYRKRIVGIMLESFPGFPERLPESIDDVRRANCLRLLICYYDAMYSKLTSGEFLTSASSKDGDKSPDDTAIHSDVPPQLTSLAALPMSDRSKSIETLLKLMDSFNHSEPVMRFYHYIDLYDRSVGVNEVPPYDGVIPTDLATYLSFFETLYIIVASKTIELSIIDFAYRFRFFAGCNVPIMQESELLPLGYQYPYVLAFYNMWSNYIVEHYDHSRKADSISNEIPMYESDLHKNTAVYAFAKKPETPMMIRFLNRRLEWLNLTLRRLRPDDFDVCMALQSEVAGAIEGNEEKNIFECLKPEEMLSALENGFCAGLFDGERLAAQMNLLLDPDDSENLSLDIETDADTDSVCVLDFTIVSPGCRGYAIQKTLINLARRVAENYNKTEIWAVTSPLNTYSIKSFLAQGYRIAATKPKYHSTRHYMRKILERDRT